MAPPLKRLKEIASILTRYGFEITARDLIPMRLEGRLNKRDQELANLNVYMRFRLAIQELGPVFVKFGQIMSTRPELMPPELIIELKMLNDKVEAVPFGEIRPLIEQHTGPIEDRFIYLNERPFAAASLSQAHQGKLKDGTVVVLKVQRPGIREKVSVDLSILKFLADKVDSAFIDLKIYNFPGIVEDFSKQITAELDFIRDGKNADLLARNMSTLKGIRVPKIYWEYTGRSILVMEYVRGVRIDYIYGLKKMGVDTHEIALNGLHAYLKQIFQDGFFHGDPHPGNLLVTPKGDIVFLDFGLVGILRPEKRDLLLRMLFGVINTDVNELVRVFNQLGVKINDQWVESFKDDLYLGLLETQNSDPGRPNTDAFVGVTTTMRKYHLQVPEVAVLMIKVIMMLGDDILKLYPEFDFLLEVKPYLGEIVKDRILSQAKKTIFSLPDIIPGIVEIPRNINEATKRLSTGDIRLRLAHDDIDRLDRRIDRAGYKVLLGLVLASILIGLSITVLTMKGTFSPQYLEAIIGVYTASILVAIISAYYLLKRR
ncbi:MAG: AarF/UbiB family protein [Candidatus Bathyarchaeota archaeon]|nr:AarF/UbiB family protein [Candidatus Bathyarchaeota archaeon]